MSDSRDRKIKIDICRINTDRLRNLSDGALYTTVSRLYRGNSGASTEGAQFQAKLAAFVRALESERTWTGVVKGAGAVPAKTLERLKDAQAEARLREYEIWQLQTKAGCKIRPQEEIARDAIREGRHEDAKHARAQRTLAKPARRRRSR